MAAPPEQVPCSPWTTPEEVLLCCPDLDPGYDLTAVINFASALLFRLSGRQFPGECERTVWPCSGNNCGCGCGCGEDGCGGFAGALGNDWWWAWNNYPSYPVRTAAGSWINCGPCGGKCCVPSVSLPATVNEIIEIVINGEVLPPDAYAIQAYRRVVRVDGGSWPCTNDLTGDVGDPGTWTISFNYGKPVPVDGRFAASKFACELAKNNCGGESCLPQRLKEITRQGVEMAFADPLEFLEKSQTGIYEVDMWLQSVNPSKLKRRARLHRPDRPGNITTYTG
jgi:hypothetical protein